MSDQQPPRPPRRRPPDRPKGFEDVPELSPEEVERRVDVRGGGAPRAPIERAPVRDRRAPRPRPRERTVARDSMLLLGLVVVGLVAVRVFLPDGPLSSLPSASPDASEVAVGSFNPPSIAPTRSPSVQTLEPHATPTPGATAVPVTEAPTATNVPAPTPTLKPGETPKPTPKVTPSPTPGPTLATATVIVKLHVINNSGGTASAADWDVLIIGEGGSASSPKRFAGSESGTSVKVPAGKGYRVVDDASVSGYAGATTDGACLFADGSGGLAAGATVTCTLTRNDRPRVRVKTHVINDDGGTSTASDWAVTVSGENVSPRNFSGSEAGTIVVVGFNLTFQVGMSGPGGYSKTSEVGDCGPTPLGLDDPATTCTFTYDDDPPAPGGGLPWLLLPILPRRRWLASAPA